MAAKDVKFSADARERMLRGVDILANAGRSRWATRAATSSSRSRSARRADQGASPSPRRSSRGQ